VELNAMEAKTGKRRAHVLLLLVLAVIAAAALVAERFHLRLDLSADRANTLSEASRKLHEEIPEKLLVTYYITPSLADRHPGPRAVEDFLRELEAASRGKISVSLADPSSGEQARAAESFGLAPQRMQIVEQNEQRVALVYSGVVLQYLGRSQVIPFAIGAETLEYDVVKAARALLSERRSLAAILVGDADKSLANDYRSLSQAFAAAGWETKELQRGEEVPPESSVLVVLGNADMDDYDAYRVDSFVASGGKALFAVKGVDVQASYGLSAAPLKDTAILRLLESYGIRVREELVLDPSSLTIPFQTPGPTGGMQLRYVRYPHWVVTRPEYRDAKNPLTARLAGLDLFWPSPLEIVKREGIEAAELVKSTAKAWLQTKDFAVGPDDEFRYAAEAGSTTGQYLLAASLSGSFPSAFAGKPVPKREGAAALPPPPARSQRGRILVVGSADFANDLMGMTDSGFNASFVADAAEWLASGDELVAIKGRGSRDPRLNKVREPARRAALASLAYALNLVVVPGAVIAYGAVRAGKRRRAARELERGGPPAAGAAEGAVDDAGEGRSE